MRAAALLFVPICALTGSLALPQTISGSSISLPGVNLSPADQTACIQSCSLSVAQNRPDALDACLDATGESAPTCLCNDATLSAEMQKCFGARCPPLQGRCAAIVGGSSSISGTGLSSTGTPGTPGTGNQSAGDVSFPDVQIPPAQQTACVQSCSVDVAATVPDALDACVDSTGNSAANCMCTDATLAAEMHDCFGARCAPLQGRCAAILDGGIFVAGTTVGGGSAGTPATGNEGVSSVSIPGVQLSPEDQTACVQSCSDDVVQNFTDTLDACVDDTGNSAATCMCTDATLAAAMQNCFAARCAPLQGRCAAIVDGKTAISGATVGTGGSTPGTVSGGTSAPGGAGTNAPGTASSGTSSPGTVSGGTSSPESAGSGTPGTADSAAGAPEGSADGPTGGSTDGASGSSSDNGAGGNSPGTSAPGAPAGDQPAPESGVPASPSGTTPSSAEASPSTPSPAADDVNPDAGNLDNGAGANGAVPLALALSLAFGLFL